MKAKIPSYQGYLILLIFTVSACALPDNRNSVQHMLDKLRYSAHQSDKQRIALWDSLKSNEQIPYIHEDSVLFLFRGEAQKVSWNGDFNSWSENRSFKNQGTKIEGTDIWYLKTSFPKDARLDYKVVIDGEDWILDPANPHIQWSGFGPNSELRMPEWEEEKALIPRESIDKGSLSDYYFIESVFLNYTLRYRTYLPAGLHNLTDLPVVYFTDGHEYSDDRLGAAIIVLDNLIASGKIEPVLAVFVEPLNPDDPSENRRTEEFGMNIAYRDFFFKELIPEIESNYDVRSEKMARAIVGTSLGGLNATFFAFSEEGMFGYAGIQSPAYWYREKIYDFVKNADNMPGSIYMSTGTIGDNLSDARTMKNILEKRTIKFKYEEVNECHSWGAWAAQLDDMLIHFFGT